MKIKVFDMTGTVAADAQQGQALYDLIYPYIKAEEQVELDFTDVRIYVTTFFDYSICQLLRDFDAETLNWRLLITHLPPYADTKLRKCIENAQHYYSMLDY